MQKETLSNRIQPGLMKDRPPKDSYWWYKMGMHLEPVLIKIHLNVVKGYVVKGYAGYSIGDFIVDGIRGSIQHSRLIRRETDSRKILQAYLGKEYEDTKSR